MDRINLESFLLDFLGFIVIINLFTGISGD